MKRQLMGRMFVAAVVVGTGMVVMSGLGGGCTLVHSDNKVERSGRWVSDASYFDIRPGKTDEAWLLSNLGEPSTKSESDKGAQVWKWRYTERKESKGEVFILFSGSDSKSTDGAVCVEMEDGVVKKKWRE